ncbi:MAG: hypothetical protein L3K08_03290, partial [Thermoplasmata archaeon]|nr:hypothetical protein [Thermoplasmata archaeon]
MVRARRASGGREGDLLDRASRLRKSVDDLLPKLGPECPPDRFDRLRAALEEVRSDRDDRDRLLRRARGWGGEDMAKAYAGLLAFYLEPEMPALLVATFPTGEISFAPLSKGSRESEVAVQQSDDARRLLLGYLPWARKGFHFFATSHQLYCTGPSPTPPPEFREAKLKDLPYRTVPSSDGGSLECTHLNEGVPGIALEVGWPGAHRRIRICRRCAKDDRHLLG